ncbi:hypothetical protein T484DRAFT_1745272 [Baffinella frigidus]|nr:hypothetical protein T484DRAFT_1745272 [Cryptophyta sp. CCMP2293]
MIGFPRIWLGRRKLLLVALQCVVIAAPVDWWPGAAASSTKMRHLEGEEGSSLTSGMPCTPWPGCAGAAINWTTFFGEMEAMGDCKHERKCTAAERVKEIDGKLEMERVWERRLAQAEAAQVEEEDEFWREHLGRVGANLQKIEALRRELQGEEARLGGEYLTYLDSLSADSLRTRVRERVSKTQQTQVAPLPPPRPALSSRVASRRLG